jgi:hypothetical protein
MSNIMRVRTLFCVILLHSGVNSAANAADKAAPPRPEVFQKLVDCKALTDSAARLACYDARVAEIDAAERNADVVVVDRAQVKKANRGLFGLGLPKFGALFGRDNEKDEEVSEIEAKIKSASVDRAGNWTLTLDDGARWVQIVPKSINDPRPGQSVTIKRATMGSYMARVENRAAIRVKRVN